MQIMHDSTPTQIKDIFPDPTVAGAATLPAPHMGQGMFHGYALTQLCPPLRRALAFTQLLPQGFIGMNADTAARGASGTAVPQRTAGTRGGGELDDLSWGKGHALATRTPQGVALPIELEGSFGKIRPLPHGPRLAENGPRLAPLLPQLTGQIGPVNRQFPPRALWHRQVRFNRVGDTGLGRSGGRDAHRHNQTRVQIAQPMAFVTIYEQTPTLAPVAHLGIFDAEAPIFGDAVAQGWCAIRRRGEVLGTHLLRHCHTGYGTGGRLLLEGLGVEPLLHRLEGLEETRQGLRLPPGIIPVQIQGRCETRGGE